MPRRTARQIEQLEKQIYDVLKADNPQSVRHVFYRMTDPRLPEPVPKTEHGYKQLQDRVAKMRRAGTLPYNWIVDATRSGSIVNVFETLGQLIGGFAYLYRQDVWGDLDTHVEVWCESRSIAGVITGVCNECAVRLYPSGGFSSMTLAYEAAMAINATGKRRAEIVYVGDYDPAGVLIDNSIENEMHEHLCGVELSMRRIAVNLDQIEEMDLPTKPRKATDRRRLDIEETVEAEAIPAGVMREMVRAAVAKRLPEGMGTLAAVKEHERETVEGLRNLALLCDEIGLTESNEALVETLE